MKRTRTRTRTIGAETPAKLGFRMPAEWEWQKAVWFSWPHKQATWPGAFRPIPAKFAEIIAVASEFEDVCVNIAGPLQKAAARLIGRAGAVLARVHFYDHETNDAWCRDHGPIFVRNDRTLEVALTDWKFNSWGGKYLPCDDDDRVPGRMGAALRLRRFRNPMVLEGGSIDVNGAGLLLTTEACLLHPNRNPQKSRAGIERELKSFLGVKEVIWLGEGIEGDDTDGHVDDLTRFFAEDGIVTAVERNPRDANHRPLQENRARLGRLRTAKGRRFRIVELPMPRAVYRKERRLPMSYANFLIINGAVLMPTFRQPRPDREAAELLAACFPTRQVVPIDCLELVWGGGTLHCISQQQPA